MKLWFAGLILALATALFPTLATAQTWRTISSSNSSVIELDFSSIKIESGKVRSWVKSSNAVTMRMPGTLKYFKYTISSQITDCKNESYKFELIQYYDEKGNSVRTINSPDTQFVPAIPGSTGLQTIKAICNAALARSALKPTIPYNLNAPDDWSPVGVDASNNVEWYYSPSSIKKYDDIIIVGQKSVHRNISKMQDGTEFKYYFVETIINCSTHLAGMAANDLYSASGELVYSFRYDVKDIKLGGISPGSLYDSLLDKICESSIPEKTNDEPETVATDLTMSSSGTGWIGPKGYLITANHVISGAKEVRLAINGRIVGTADLVVADPANDLAVLRPRLGNGALALIPARAAPAKLGEKAFTLGYPVPQLLGSSIKITSGEVSATVGNGADGGVDDPRFLQISVPVQSGNSGGPLIDERGNAIGVIISKAIKLNSSDEIPQNVGWAIKIRYIEALIENLPELKGAVAGNSKLKEVNNAFIAGLYKNSVFLVISMN